MAGSFGLQWHITDRCDQRCRHCYIFNSASSITQEDFNIEYAGKVIESFLSFCQKYDKTPLISITGGDPILHPNFWQIVEKLYSKQISFSILGNPFHITAEGMEKLTSYGCRAYQLSLDELERTHDSFRRPGSFRATLSKIKELSAAGFAVNVMSTVSRTNYQEMPDVARLSSELGVNVYAFARYCPTHHDTETMLSPSEYRNFLDTMWRTYESLQPTSTQFNLKDHLWMPYLVEQGYCALSDDEDLVYSGCNCGISHLTLLSDGQVYACRRFESPIGNIFTEDFETIFFSSQMCAYREIEKIVGCKDCSLLNYCRGCRAVAFGATGDFYAKDPQCWRND